jgi:hypothetical protein
LALSQLTKYFLRPSKHPTGDVMRAKSASATKNIKMQMRAETYIFIA